MPTKKSKAEQLRAIGAVLSSYVYGELPEGEVSIGDQPNEFWLQRDLSTDDLHIFATKKQEGIKRKVFVSHRGTNSGAEAIETWPIIATSTENLKYNLWSNYFNDRIAYVADALRKLDTNPKDLNLNFAGHSLGGTMSRVAALHFYDQGYESRGFSFNPGNGILSSSIAYKMTQEYIKKNSDRLVEYVVPGPMAEGAKMLKNKVSEEMLGNWLNSTKYHNHITEQHNTLGDAVSALGSFEGDTSFYLNKEGSWWNMMSNHDMNLLRDQILLETGFPEMGVKESAAVEGASQSADEDVVLPRDRKRMLGHDVPKQSTKRARIDPLQIRDIETFQPIVTLSRLSFFNDMNKFNT